MKKINLLIVCLIVVSVIAVSGCTGKQIGASTQGGTGSISGIVTPADSSIRVQLIQNLSLVTKITANEDGTFSFSDIPEGNYGLIFLWGNGAYVYNDSINTCKYWDCTNITDSISIYSGKDNKISIDLNNEFMDYLTDYFSVTFNQSIPENEIENLFKKYNCIIKDNTTILYANYRIIPPADKTILELIEAFRNEPIVESSDYELFVQAVNTGGA